MDNYYGGKTVQYTSAITGKTYTLPGFYEKERWNGHTCNSNTAKLVCTYITKSRGTYSRMAVYSRPRGGYFEVHADITRDNKCSFNRYYRDCKDPAEHIKSAERFAGEYWRRMWATCENLPKFGGRVPKNIELPHFREWRINTAVTKSIARHARKVNRAAILDANRAVKCTIAATRKHQPERPEQLKFDLAV